MNDFIILIKTKIKKCHKKTRKNKNKNRKLVNQENLPHCFVKYKMKAWFRKYSTWALFFTEVFTLIIVHLLLVSDWVLDQQETFMWFFLTIPRIELWNSSSRTYVRAHQHTYLQMSEQNNTKELMRNPAQSSPKNSWSAA